MDSGQVAPGMESEISVGLILRVEWQEPKKPEDFQYPKITVSAHNTNGAGYYQSTHRHEEFPAAAMDLYTHYVHPAMRPFVEAPLFRIWMDLTRDIDYLNALGAYDDHLKFLQATGNHQAIESLTLKSKQK